MANATIPGGGGGKIKSVGLTMPGEFSVANSPLTASGTLAVTKVNQNANLVYAGPTSGIAAQPTFRSIVAADLPAGVGTVTSVGLSTNAAWLTVGSSPITGAGTITLNSTTGLTANQVLATPNGGTGVVGLRSLVAADIPSLPASQITTGQLALARGGTNADLSATGAANNFLKQSSSGAAITVGTIASADLTTALTTPGAIGGTTPAAGSFTTLGGTIITASTRFVGPIIAPASDSTTALRFTKTDGSTNVVVLDTTNSRVTISATSFPLLRIGGAASEPQLYLNPYTGASLKQYKFISANLYYDGSALVYDDATRYGVGLRLVTDTTTSASGFEFITSTAVGGATLFAAAKISSAGIFTETAVGGSTTSVVNALILDNESAVTPAAGFGTGILFVGKDNNTGGISMGRVRTPWTNATNGAQVSNMILSVYNITTEIDAFSLTPTGSTLLATDTATATVTNALVVDHSTSGGPAAGYGTGIAWQGQSSTTASQAMGRVRTAWTTSTHATRKARVTFSVYDTAERDAIFIEASGSAPMISVFSVTTPIIQPTTAIASSTVVIGAGTPLTDASTFDGYTAAQVVKALRNLGWLA